MTIEALQLRHEHMRVLLLLQIISGKMGIVPRLHTS